MGSRPSIYLSLWGHFSSDGGGGIRDVQVYRGANKSWHHCSCESGDGAFGLLCARPAKVHEGGEAGVLSERFRSIFRCPKASLTQLNTCRFASAGDTMSVLLSPARQNL